MEPVNDPRRDVHPKKTLAALVPDRAFAEFGSIRGDEGYLMLHGQGLAAQLPQS